MTTLRARLVSIPFVCAVTFGCGSSSNGTSGAGGAAAGASAVVGSGGTSATGGSNSTTGGSGTTSSGGHSTTGGTSSSGTGGSGGPSTGGTSSSGGASSTGGAPPIVGACDALPSAGTWQQITPPGVSLPRALVVDPFDTAKLWVGAAPSGTGQPAGNGGLYLSTDCGSTWTHVNTGSHGSELDGARIWSMAVDPVDKGVVYVVGAYGPSGLWKSTNGGVDWTQLFPSGSEFAQVVQYNFVGSVVMGPENHKHLVVGTHGNCGGKYAPACMAESIDGGATWTIFTTPFLSGWAEQTGPYILDANTIVFQTLTNGLWLTTDHGANWKNVTPAGVSGATGAEYAHRPLVSTSNGTFYLPSYNQGGLLSSSDVGRTWSRVKNAPTGSYELGIAIGGGKIYLGDYGGKTYATTTEADPTVWSTLAPPPAPGTDEGPKALEYDETHHLLYSSNVSGGLWRIVVQ